MKRFRFQLESVLNYRQQNLDALIVELDRVQGRVLSQEYKRDEAFARLAEYDAAFAEKKAEGITPLEAIEYESGQQVLDRRAQQEQKLLEQRQKELDDKRQEVIEARQEIHVVEKLKELRRSEYDAAVAKADEKEIDDLTAARRAAATG